MEFNEDFVSEDFLLVSFAEEFKEFSFLYFSDRNRNKKYSAPKRFLKTNHRGQHARWVDRKVAKEWSGGKGRFKGRPIPSFDVSKIKLEDLKEDFILSSNLKYDYIYDSSFLGKGMNVLINSEGEIGAVSFNPDYEGSRVIKINYE